MSRRPDAAPGTVTARSRRIDVRGARRCLGIVALLSGLALCGVASAYWSTSGTGVAAAATTTLAAPTGVSATGGAASATVSFTGVTPPSGAVDGYVVTRWSGGTPSPACSTDPALPGTWLSSSTFSCVDSGVTAGSYTYRVTARFRSWTAESAPSASVVVTGDATLPTQVITASGNGHVSGTTLFYRSGSAGSFTLTAAVTDAGSGPASATFPATGGGFTHLAEQVAHTSGPLPTRSYTSNPFTWSGPNPGSPGAYTVTGRDVAGNARTTVLTFTADSSSPTGGALNVNGTNGTAGGSTSDEADDNGTFTGTFTNYGADTGSGLPAGGSVLTREVGSYSNGACVSFGAATTITSISESNVASGCYRYTLTGTDRVGNASVLRTTVRVDRDNPTVTLSLNEVTGQSHYDPVTNTVYFDNDTAGSFTLTATVTDAESGPDEVNFPADGVGQWTHNNQTVAATGTPPTMTATSSTYAWSNGTNNLPDEDARTITAYDLAGRTGTIVPTFVNDDDNPVGGALTVNGAAANAAGTTSNSSATSWTIGTRTDWTDAGSGLTPAGSVLTRESATWNGIACGTFGGSTTLAGQPAQTGMSTSTCYRYTLSATDNLGNAVSISTVVRVNPAGPTVTNMVLNDGAGNDGQIDNDDTIVITFSEQMDVSTFCSTWTNDAANQAITANNTVYVRLTNGNTADDYLEVRTTAGACGGSFNLGRIELGDTGHIANNPWTDFGGTGGNASTIAWNAGSRTMTITLGEGSVGPGTPSNDVGNYVATYTPHTAIRGTASAVLPVWNTFVTGSASHF